MNGFEGEWRGDAQASRSPVYRPGRVTPMRNVWLALAHASRVEPGKPLQRLLYDTPIVLWRGRDGGVVAMEDRCPHRRAPLSAGKLVEAGLQCAYHGWSFNADGACVRIPSLGAAVGPREGIRVRTYPTLLRYGYVWIWWGEPADADPALMPDIPFLHPDRPSGYETSIVFDCSSDLLVENVLDLTHLDFIHGWLLGDPDSSSERVTYSNTDEILTMQRRSEGRRPPLAQAAMFGFPKSQDFVGTSRIYLRSNLIVSGVWWRPPGWGQFVVMPNLPETGDRIRNDVTLVVFGPRWYRKLAELFHPLISGQDNRILKAQHPAYHQWDHMSDGRTDVSVAGDKASVKYRELREALLARQALGDFSYADGWAGEPAETALETPRIR